MDNHFGNYIKKLRGTDSIRETAKNIGISHTYLNSLEKGFDPRTKKERKPTPLVVKQLSDYFKVPYTDLLQKAGYITENELSSNKQLSQKEMEEYSTYLYNKYLDKYNKSTIEGKAIRELPNEISREIILESIRKTFTNPFLTFESFEEIAKTDYILLVISNSIVEEYVQTFKSNHNIINLVDRKLDEFLFLEDYPHYDNDKRYTFKDTTILISEIENSIDNKLIEELKGIISTTKDKLSDLYDKYPDKGKEKKFNYLLIRNEEDTSVSYNLGNTPEPDNFNDLEEYLFNNLEQLISNLKEQKPELYKKVIKDINESSREE